MGLLKETELKDHVVRFFLAASTIVLYIRAIEGLTPIFKDVAFGFLPIHEPFLVGYLVWLLFICLLIAGTAFALHYITKRYTEPSNIIPRNVFFCSYMTYFVYVILSDSSALILSPFPELFVYLLAIALGVFYWMKVEPLVLPRETPQPAATAASQTVNSDQRQSPPQRPKGYVFVGDPPNGNRK